jgi:hypothetical protein
MRMFDFLKSVVYILFWVKRVIAKSLRRCVRKHYTGESNEATDDPTKRRF